MNWLVEEARKVGLLEGKAIRCVPRSRDGVHGLQRGVRSEARATRLASAALWIFTSSSEQWGSIDGFSHGVTWSDLCFRKITWAVRGEWTRGAPTMAVAHQSHG